MSSYLEAAQRTFLRGPDEYLAHRLAYYSDLRTISTEFVTDRVIGRSSENAAIDRISAMERLRLSKPEIIILTATHNRLESVKIAHEVLQNQQSAPNWSWVIIDNGSDGTEEYFKRLDDPRVVTVQYLEQTGCAYPVRNFGLDFIHAAMANAATGKEWIMIVDSDDRLHNEHSLHELSRMRGSTTLKPATLLHGFAECEYSQDDGTSFRGSHPHNNSSSFPKIDRLSEVFDAGLNILSGMFPIEFLSWLRYPPEFSFEDNGFNHKILLQAGRAFDTWKAIEYPIVFKVFNNETMAAQNDLLGDTDQRGDIGEHKVIGVRALIVSYLGFLTDYFIREEL